MNEKINALMSVSLDNNMNLNTTTLDSKNLGYIGDFFPEQKSISAYSYWTDFYYPKVIHESYPVYIQERTRDKGKEAFEIIKILKDKKFVKLEKVGDFVDLMDELIKIL